MVSRTACLFFMICHCVSIDTGFGECKIFGSFEKLPLSCPKTLWEAKTRMEWETEYSFSNNGQGTSLQTIGMLIEASKRNHDPTITQLMDHWNCRADNLGILLTTVASTI